MRQTTKLQFLVLASLVRCPWHPYAIKQEIIELTERRVWPSESSIRGTLASLVRDGLIQECFDSGPDYWLKTVRAVPYELTDKGRQRLKKELETYRNVIDVTRMWLNKFGG